MATIPIPRPLREKLGEEASDALADLLNQRADSLRARRSMRLVAVPGKLQEILGDDAAQALANLLNQIVRSQSGDMVANLPG